MTRYDHRTRMLAAGLSALAGYVDSIGFLSLGGFFVSFMSGNSTRLGVGLAQGSVNAAIAGGLIAVFVGGVVLGALVGRWAGQRRRMVVLAAVALLLFAAATLGGAGLAIGAVICMALAMGVENAVFEEDGEVRIGLTYMTGTLVKLGQRIAGTLTGGERLAWAPFLLLWAGLVGGAALGATAYAHLGFSALWIAAAAASAFAILAGRLAAA